jgi:hypothetical protein
LQQADANQGVLQAKVNVVNLSMPEIVEPVKNLNADDLEKHKATIKEKGQHKDWTYREQALQAIQEVFTHISKQSAPQENDFIVLCLQILVSALEDNNIQIYLVAIEVASVFLEKTIQLESILDSLPGLLKAVVVRTTDTNTRVRKRSTELVNQVWES